MKRFLLGASLACASLLLGATSALADPGVPVGQTADGSTEFFVLQDGRFMTMIDGKVASTSGAPAAPLASLVLTGHDVNNTVFFWITPTGQIVTTDAFGSITNVAEPGSWAQ